jgi:predicted dehydrogenase
MKNNRRQFVKQTTAAIAGLSIVPRHVLGKGHKAPSDRFNVGVIGTGAQSSGLIKRISRIPQARVIAGCDVHQKRLVKFSQLIEEQYQKYGVKGKAEIHEDYQKLLENPDIDGIVVSTPDHWHAIPSIDAMKAGKHVYCEKPMSHNINEGRVMEKVARKYNRVLQTGSMQRSRADFRKACELVRNGYLGKIEKVWVEVGNPSAACNLPYQPTPDYLNWERWLGPALLRSYHKVIVENSWFPDWRWYREYGGGILSDWGAHMFDIVQWALGMDQSGPVSYQAPMEPTASRGLKMHYKNGIEVEHRNFGRGFGVRFFGSEGTMDISRQYFETSNKELVDVELKSTDERLYVSESHETDWITAAKAGTKPICDVETGHRTATICHIANLAYEFRRPLRWDPVKEEFIDDFEANLRRGKQYRKPYKLNP